MPLKPKAITSQCQRETWEAISNLLHKHPAWNAPGGYMMVVIVLLQSATALQTYFPNLITMWLGMHECQWKFEQFK